MPPTSRMRIGSVGNNQVEGVVVRVVFDVGGIDAGIGTHAVLDVELRRPVEGVAYLFPAHQVGAVPYGNAGVVTE